ncbi:hypothetical protein CGK39_12815 [Vibrio parahaemolyticus]|uniref:hypothetical protein n=1 Tax=Vibrio parahaemolyticus TaxID=670 RepID=UPI0010D6D1FB|nr:hypothetical protein [Vibrio parahaemolyticus]MBE4478658.1 hypothetical protein [Vibrio parahaemolyticus]TBT44508.1 hypothetical protein D5E79_09685 [Vibrio parahaemolyticus]TNZ82981.1 hypothetical protein CGK39_12815 [Vibrio parahaemolyticus]TOZ96223.1 hypothetical protein DXE04_10185 [Vibrio parahaemolyticus]HCH1565847.1 hypothetical protein [Vibrio parahaemolyticus]
MKIQKLELTSKEEAKAMEHGRNIGMAVANLAYNPEALPLLYTEQFLENMDVEYGDGGGIPAAVMSKKAANGCDDPVEFFFDKKLHFASNTVTRNEDTLTIHTSFPTDGQSMAKVTCQHTLSKQQTIPLSVYPWAITVKSLISSTQKPLRASVQQPFHWRVSASIGKTSQTENNSNSMQNSP